MLASKAVHHMMPKLSGTWELIIGHDGDFDMLSCHKCLQQSMLALKFRAKVATYRKIADHVQNVTTANCKPGHHGYHRLWQTSYLDLHNFDNQL